MPGVKLVASSIAHTWLFAFVFSSRVYSPTCNVNHSNAKRAGPLIILSFVPFWVYAWFCLTMYN